MSRRALWLLLIAGCARNPPLAAPANEVAFGGTCDASAAVALSDHTFLVADDEDNVLRSYDATRGGAPLAMLEVSAALHLPMKKKGAPEVDIEAAARIGDRAYFITSHGRNSSGKLRQERLRFFATSAPAAGAPVPIGRAYEGLLADLLAEPRLTPFELAAAAALAPKAPGGLNIEGMTERREGGVWLGFRNPIPGGRALLVPLLNPEELVQPREEGAQAGLARFGDPTTLELAGLGVRALAFWRGRYLIAAGSFDGGQASRLFRWNGSGAPQAIEGPQLQAYNPEAFFAHETQERVMLLSDDGSRLIGGKPCKRLKDANEKRFRGLWLHLP